MTFLRSRVGLSPQFASPVEDAEVVDVITEEAAVQTPTGAALPITSLVAEGDHVAQGGAVACLRHAPDITFVAPIAGRVARLSVLPGHRLSEIILFRDADGAVQQHTTTAANTATGLRSLLHSAGFWPRLRRRPFGGMPAADEVPAAIFVMLADTRPFAPDPQLSIDGREDQFARGLDALGKLADGPVFLCGPQPTLHPDLHIAGLDLRWITCGPRHPQGSAGLCIHRAFPAGLDVPVWDLHAGDVADLGALLGTGELPMLRHVRIAGAGLQKAQCIRTHAGADLRQLTLRIMAPGPNVLMTGSHLDGHAARWLGQTDRHITALPRRPADSPSHWLIAALTASAASKPLIPTAALTQSFGAALPAAPFIRALGAGDEEAAMTLGVLSLLEEDIALADYALGAGGDIMHQLRIMLDRIQTEFAP